MRPILVGILCFLPAICAHGQALTGFVVDRNGAAVINALVVIFDRNTERARTQTDQRGRFSIPETINERTRLVVNAAGFATFEQHLTNTGSSDITIVLQPVAVAGDVTVTIAKTETRLSETPASIVVLGRNEIEASASQTIDDTLRQVAGFSLFRRSSSITANPTTHGANLRGVSGSGASRAAVLLDGLALNDAFGGWTYWSRVTQIAVEQAEVLRGGASSLYGSGGLSGAVNLTTSRPSEGEEILRVQTYAGSQSTFDGGVFGTIERSGWAFNLTADAFKTGGYVPVAEDERGLVDTPANSKHTSLIAGIERRFGDPTRTTALLFARINIFTEDRENGTSMTNNATYFRQIAVGGDLENANFGRFELRTFLQTQIYDQTFSVVSADRNTETLTRLQRVPSQAAGGSLFWTRTFGDHAVASSFEFRDVRGFSDEVGFALGVPTSRSKVGGRERTVAIFAQDLLHVRDRLTISVGGRYDRWRNFDARSVTRILSTNSGTTFRFPERTESAFSPRIAAIFSIAERVSLYGSYSRSFRAPTLNELYRGFRVGNVVTQPNENLRAEYANTFEGGVNINAIERRLNLRANAFFTNVNDPVVSVTLATTPTLITRQRQNVGETRTRGLELDAEFAIGSELRLSASYLLVSSRVTEFPGNMDLVGKFLPQVAPRQFSFQLSYRPPSRFSFELRGRISSGQWEDDLNTLRLRPYFTIDATAAYRIHKNLDVFAAAENIFNSRYDIGLTPVRTVAAPAFIRAGLRLNFGKR